MSNYGYWVAPSMVRCYKKQTTLFFTTFICCCCCWFVYAKLCCCTCLIPVPFVCFSVFFFLLLPFLPNLSWHCHRVKKNLERPHWKELWHCLWAGNVCKPFEGKKTVFYFFFHFLSAAIPKALSKNRLSVPRTGNLTPNGLDVGPFLCTSLFRKT